MSLTPPQRKQLHDTLTAVFSEDELRAMLSLHMGVDLDKIVAPNVLSRRAADLIAWAEEQGRTAELVAAAYNYRHEHGGRRRLTAAAVPSWLKWVSLFIAVPLLVGVMQLFIEYGFFANRGDDRAAPTAQTEPRTPTVAPDTAPAAVGGGVPTLDIAYGESKQAAVDGISVLVSVPANPNPYLSLAAPDSIEAAAVAGGASVTGTLHVGECLLAGSVTVTLLDTQGGAVPSNRFAVSRVGDGETPACVNSGAETGVH